MANIPKIGIFYLNVWLLLNFFQCSSYRNFSHISHIDTWIHWNTYALKSDKVTSLLSRKDYGFIAVDTYWDSGCIQRWFTHRTRARGDGYGSTGKLPADQSGPPGTPRSQREAAALTDSLARNNAFTGLFVQSALGHGGRLVRLLPPPPPPPPHRTDPRSVPRPYRHIAGLQVIG